MGLAARVRTSKAKDAHPMTIDRKAAFDAVKAVVPNIWNVAGTVDLMNAMLDMVKPDGRRIGPKGLALIKRWEGCKLHAYPDPGTGGDPWTIGWGTTRMDGRAVKRGDQITQVRADQLLESQLVRYADEVSAAIGNAPTSQEQFDALVSFHYNTGKISQATLTSKHVRGDFAGASAEFGKWVFAAGRKLPGLVNRRADEAQLYRSGS